MLVLLYQFSTGWEGAAHAGSRNKIWLWNLKNSFLNCFPFIVHAKSWAGLMTALTGSEFSWLMESWHLSGQQKAADCQEGIMEPVIKLGLHSRFHLCKHVSVAVLSADALLRLPLWVLEGQNFQGQSEIVFQYRRGVCRGRHRMLPGWRECYNNRLNPFHREALGTRAGDIWCQRTELTVLIVHMMFTRPL